MRARVRHSLVGLWGRRRWSGVRMLAGKRHLRKRMASDEGPGSHGEASLGLTCATTVGQAWTARRPGRSPKGRGDRASIRLLTEGRRGRSLGRRPSVCAGNGRALETSRVAGDCVRPHPRRQCRRAANARRGGVFRPCLLGILAQAGSRPAGWLGALGTEAEGTTWGRRGRVAAVGRNGRPT